MTTGEAQARPWRVAVTREESASGPLSAAVRATGLTPAPCPLLVCGPPPDEGPLRAAAARLDRYDWVICASRRSVDALWRVRPAPWPEGVRSAAVGPATAEALRAYGARPAPVTAAVEGADALWATLRTADRWPGRAVLVLTTAGGRETIGAGLTDAGAHVDVVEAYAMQPLSAHLIRAAWIAASPDAAIVASPRAVSTLVDAVGRDSLAALQAVVAIGPPTAARLDACGVPCAVAPAATFTEAARTLAELWASHA